VLGSLGAELFKLRKRWSVRILTGIFVLLVILLTYLLPYVIYRNPPPNFSSSLPRGVSVDDLVMALYPPNFFRVALSSGTGLGSAIAIILGVLAQGSEYGWGTLKTIYTQRPGRLAIFAAKCVALGAVTLVMAALIMMAAAGSGLALVLLDGHAVSWPDAVTVLQATAALWLILCAWTALGVTLSVLFQQSALSMGIGLVYVFVVEGLVFGIFGSNPTLRDIEKGFPGANAQALADAFGQANASRPSVALVGPTQAVLVLLGFVVVFLAISALLTARRDLS
jgi:ABC-type transport system involved in multi-copper enzyme maturation permease subunit